MKQILIDVRELLSNERYWVKGVMVEDGLGKHLSGDVFHERACGWCLEGAVQRVCGKDGEQGNALDVLNFLWENVPYKFSKCDTVAEANDSEEMDHKTLMKWIDKAIEAAE